MPRAVLTKTLATWLPAGRGGAVSSLTTWLGSGPTPPRSDPRHVAGMFEISRSIEIAAMRDARPIAVRMRVVSLSLLQPVGDPAAAGIRILAQTLLESSLAHTLLESSLAKTLL